MKIQMLLDIDFCPIVLKEREEQIQSAFRAGTDNLIVTKLLSQWQSFQLNSILHKEKITIIEYEMHLNQKST